MQDVKFRLICSIIAMVLGIWGLSSGNVPVAIFLIVISLLGFLLVFTDYKENKKDKEL